MEDIQKDIENINNLNKKIICLYKEVRKLKREIKELEILREIKIDLLTKYYEYEEDFIFMFHNIKEDEVKHYFKTNMDKIKYVYIMGKTEGYNIKIFVKDYLNNYVDISDKFVKVKPLIEDDYLTFKYINQEGKSFLPPISIFFIYE